MKKRNEGSDTAVQNIRETTNPTHHLLLQEFLVEFRGHVKLDVFDAIVLALHVLELLRQRLMRVSKYAEGENDRVC
jgi:hypothetical protein